MKFLIIQENGRHEANRHFRECFCLQRSLKKYGHHADIYGYGHKNEIYDRSYYDVIINLENYDSGWVPDLSKDTSIKILWSIDAHCRGVEPYRREFNRGKYDIVLQATKELVDALDRSVWFPNCYDDSLIKPLNTKKEYLVGFCGNFPTQEREQLIKNLDRFYPVKKDVFVIGDKMVEAINSYHIHWNQNMSFDINYRNFETIGCGTALLTSFNPNYEELGFINGENCLVYNNLKSCVAILDFMKDSLDSDIKEIARKGLDLAKKHTYDVRVEQLLRML